MAYEVVKYFLSRDSSLPLSLLGRQEEVSGGWRVESDGSKGLSMAAVDSGDRQGESPRVMFSGGRQG